MTLQNAKFCETSVTMYVLPQVAITLQGSKIFETSVTMYLLPQVAITLEKSKSLRDLGYNVCSTTGCDNTATKQNFARPQLQCMFYHRFR